jgi:hypothetical protein
LRAGESAARLTMSEEKLMHRFKFLSLILAAGAAVTACSDDGEGFDPNDDVDVRVVHVAPGAPALDVQLTDTRIADNLVYGQSTTYSTVPGGDQTLLVASDFAGQSEELLSVETPLTAGGAYTVVLSGTGDGLVPFVLPDDNTAPPTGQAKFRLMHFAQSAQAVDVYITAPGADLTGQSPTFSALSYGDATSYATLPVGAYQVRIAAAGLPDIVIDAGTVQLAEGDVRTAVAIESPAGGAPYSAVLLDDRQP